MFRYIVFFLSLTGFFQVQAQVFLSRNQQNLDTLRKIMDEPPRSTFSSSDSALWFFEFGRPIKMVRIQKTKDGYQQVFKALYSTRPGSDILTFERQLDPKVWQKTVGRFDEKFFDLTTVEGRRARIGLSNWVFDVHFGDLTRRIQYVGDESGPNKRVFKAGEALKELFFDEIRYEWNFVDSQGQPVKKLQIKWGNYDDLKVSGNEFTYDTQVSWNRKSYFYATVKKEDFKSVIIKVDLKDLQPADNSSSVLVDRRTITLYTIKELYK